MLVWAIVGRRRIKHKLLSVGIVGTVVSALCCFTPLLVVALGSLGLSAFVGGLDLVLIPALLFFTGLTIYALVQKKSVPKKSANP